MFFEQLCQKNLVLLMVDMIFPNCPLPYTLSSAPEIWGNNEVISLLGTATGRAAKTGSHHSRVNTTFKELSDFLLWKISMFFFIDISGFVVINAVFCEVFVTIIKKEISHFSDYYAHPSRHRSALIIWPPTPAVSSDRLILNIAFTKTHKWLYGSMVLIESNIFQHNIT